MDAERRAFGDSPLPPTRTEATNGVRRPSSGGPLPPFRAGSLIREAPQERVAADASYAPTSADENEEFQILPITDALAEEQRSASATEEQSPDNSLVDDFPLDAFIIPEDAQRLPTGLRAADRRKRQRASDLADRLEALAIRLRREGYSALAKETVGGDPVGALISGILAGYLAAQDE